MIFLTATGPSSQTRIISGPNLELKNTGSNFVLFAETTGDWYMSVDGAGDINNDGYDDFLVGARFNDEAGVNTGQTYLFYGRSNENWQDFDLSQANASFIGENPYEYSGNQVAGIGDINNDGFDDFSIEAILNSEAAYQAGQSYIFLGGSTNRWGMDTPISQANASYLREGGNDFAHGVYEVGDVNTDGFDDFIVSAHNNKEGGAYAGQMYLILGRPTDSWKMDISLINANASFIGNPYDILGIDAAGIGDINNDGYDDFAIGSLQNTCWFCGAEADNSGPRKVDIIFGRSSNNWYMDQTISTANVTITGSKDAPIVYDGSFSWITGIGDMNNDGFDDFAIGGYTNDDAGDDAGIVSIFLGRATSNWARNYNLTDGNAIYYGETEGSWAGFEISGVGDVNIDGFDDLLIGAPSELTIDWEVDSYVSTTEETTGKAYLIYGKGGVWDKNTSLANADRIYDSGRGGDAFANKVSEIGDINNDGITDFTISAIIPDALSPQDDLGFVQIIIDHNSGGQFLNVNFPLGSPSTTTTTTTTTTPTTTTSDTSSTSDKTSSTKTNTSDNPVIVKPMFFTILSLVLIMKRRRITISISVRS